MGRLLEKDYQRLLAFLSQLYEPVAAKDFGMHLVRLVAELLPGTTSSFDEINPSTGAYHPLSDPIPSSV